MKIIPKSQNRLVTKSDNTRVILLPIIFPIKYKLKSGETFVTDRNTGKKVLVKQKNETISADRRSAYQKLLDLKKALQIHKRYKENKNLEEGMKNLQGFFNLISPSTYIGPAFNNNKSYLDNVMSGEGTGNITSNMAIDLFTPLSVNKVSKVILTVPKTVGLKYVAPYISSKILNRNNPTIESVNDLFNINFINRSTVFGKNSGKAIHADYGDNISGFTKGTTGASIINGKLVPGHNPNTEVDYIWWNVDKPYATRINGRAFTRYIIKNEKSIPGIINIREQSRPIGLWNGKSGLVTKSERVTQEPVPLDDATIIEYNPITRVYENKLIVPDKRLNINTFNSFDLSNLLYKNLSNHLLGEEAVKMFKQYGGIKIPEGSINGKQLRMYIPEARERYGLVGNTNITDEEIALALYKHTNELGKGSAAVNSLGEPLLLFRGDTKPYTKLRVNHDLLGESSTEDNVLGTMFLDRTGIGEGWGPDRYMYLTNLNNLVMAPYRSGIETESFNTLQSKFKPDYVVPSGEKGFVDDLDISYPYYKYDKGTHGVISGSKISSEAFADGYTNQLNGFVVRTPHERDITNEVLTNGMNRPPKVGEEFLWMIPHTTDISSIPREVRILQNKAVVKDALLKNQGLLRSKADSPYRDEHSNYDYLVVPDFNAKNVKHILPYDLRIPRNWSDPNVFKIVAPIGISLSFLNNSLK